MNLSFNASTNMKLFAVKKELQSVTPESGGTVPCTLSKWGNRGWGAFSKLFITQNRCQKVFNRGLCVWVVALDIVKLTETALIYSVSGFNLGGLEALFGG